MFYVRRPHLFFIRHPHNICNKTQYNFLVQLSNHGLTFPLNISNHISMIIISCYYSIQRSVYINKMKISDTPFHSLPGVLVLWFGNFTSGLLILVQAWPPPQCSVSCIYPGQFRLDPVLWPGWLGVDGDVVRRWADLLLRADWPSWSLPLLLLLGGEAARC